MTQDKILETGTERHKIQKLLEFTMIGEVFDVTPKGLRKVYYECYGGEWTVRVGSHSYTIPNGGRGNAMKVGDVRRHPTLVAFKLDEFTEGYPAKIYVHIEWESEATEWRIGYGWDWAEKEEP